MRAYRAALLSSASWAFPGALVDLNFANGRYYTKGATGPLVCSRASAGMAQDLSGNWVSFPANTLRRTNQGLLIEEARTNGVRNATMQGASVGSPGTSPTNWIATGTTNGVTVSVIGLPTINGLPAITYSMVGTPTVTFGLNISPEAPAAIPALYGQTWTWSTYISATNQTNIGGATGLQAIQVNSVGSGIGTLTSFGVYPTPTLSRLSFSFTPNNPATAYLYPLFQFNMQSGLPVNFNVTVAAPQLELNPFINATVASAVVASGGVSALGSTTRTMYISNASSGAVFGTSAASMSVTTVGGAVTAVNSIVGAGTYNAYYGIPPSPAALADATIFGSISGTSLTVVGGVQGAIAIGQYLYGPGVTAGTTITGGSGTSWTLSTSSTVSSATWLWSSAFSALPTVTLTPTNNASQGFATSPILSPGSAMLRAADNVTINLASITNPSLWALGMTLSPLAYAQNRFLAQLDDGTGSNNSFLYLSEGGYGAEGTSTIGGVGTYNYLPAAGWTPGVVASMANFVSGGNLTTTFNKTYSVVQAATGGPTVNTLRIGEAGGYFVLNGYLSRVAVSAQSLLNN